MNWGVYVDGGIVIFLLVHSFMGWRRGLMWQAAGGLSVGLGIGLGLYFSPMLSQYALERVTSNPLHAQLIGYLAIFGLTGFVLRIIAAIVEVQAEKGLPKPERDRRRAKDRILGGIFAALKGLVIASILIAAGVAFFPSGAIWNKSILAAPFATVGSRLLPNGAVAEMRTWAKQHVASINELK